MWNKDIKLRHAILGMLGCFAAGMIFVGSKVIKYTIEGISVKCSEIDYEQEEVFDD